MKDQFRLIITLLLIVISVVFALLNTIPVKVNFFFKFIEMPLVVVIVGGLVMGVIIGMIVSINAIHKERVAKVELQHALKDAQTQKDTLTQGLNEKNQEINRLKAEIKTLEKSQPVTSPQDVHV